MATMRLIDGVEDRDAVKALVFEDLTEVGVIVEDRRSLFAGLSCLTTDHDEGVKRSNDASMNTASGLVFGSTLSFVPNIATEKFGTVPLFLLNAVELLEKHLTIEGLFRRSASVSRLKDLKIRVDEGKDLGDALPLDIASLVKQFFRELPDPLLTSTLYDNFLRCSIIEDEAEKLTAILFLCLLLPSPNLNTLRFIMHFLAKVAALSDQNKMDASNLAICLTPNLLRPGSGIDKTDKAVVCGGGAIQAETAVVYLLILHAEKIGMVSDTVVERATLFSSCCTLSEELDENRNSQEGKKNRKKRSGSLQGFMTSLSSSFSRWRSKDKPSQNSSIVSDRSALSYISFEKSSVVDGDDDLAQSNIIARVEEFNMSCCPPATPRLIRKRKAEEEMAPFSVKKRQAILSSMPQKSLLARTPFTPRTKKESGNGVELESTPCIDFAPATDMTFSATPQVHDSKILMHNKMSASSNSCARLSRRSSVGRHGCFSPKSNKKGIRNSFRGLLRRLSGSKDRQAMEKADHNGSNLSFVPSKEHATQKAENSKKSISLFRHCKKTHFSPSTFTPTDPVIDYSSHEMNGVEEVDLSFVTPVPKKTEEINTTSNERFHNWSLPPKPAVRSRFSEGGSTGLRRGRPNTLASGLPSPTHHRSLEVKQNRSDSQVNEGTTTGVIDTSPIQKHGGGEVNGFVREMQELQENEFVISNSKLNLESSEPVDDIADQIPLDSDHNRAYTEESMLVYGEMLEFSAENIDSKVGDVSSNKTVTGSQSEVTDGSETTLEPIECLEPVGGGEDVVLSRESGEHCKVLAETDSAVDLGSAATWSPKSPSPTRQSIQSQDSGLELILEGDNRASTVDKISRAESAENVHVTTHNHSLMFMKEGQPTVSIRGSVRQKKAEARLEVTAEVHKLLSKAGAFVSNVDAVIDNSENVSEPRSLNLELHCYDKKMTEGQKLQSVANKEYSLDSNSLLDGNVRIAAADAARLSSMLPSPSFRKAPVLPVTTNLLRISFRENCSQITPVVCQSLEDSLVYMKPAKDCPAKDEDLDKPGSAQTPQKGHCSSTHPKIKPALVTPGVSNCRGKLIPPYLLTSPLPKTIRTPLKPVKRLQSSPKSPGLNRLPRNIISPGKVVKPAEMTVASSSVNMDM